MRVPWLHGLKLCFPGAERLRGRLSVLNSI